VTARVVAVWAGRNGIDLGDRFDAYFPLADRPGRDAAPDGNRCRSRQRLRPGRRLVERGLRRVPRVRRDLAAAGAVTVDATQDVDDLCEDLLMAAAFVALNRHS
jgi:hypothetical protein